MAKRRLHQMDRRASIKGVRGVGVTQPVRADSLGNTGSLGGPANDDADPSAVQRLSGPGTKNRLLWFRRSTPTHQLPPNLGGQGDGPRPAVLAEDTNLAGVASSCSKKLSGSMLAGTPDGYLFLGFTGNLLDSGVVGSKMRITWRIDASRRANEHASQRLVV